MTYAEWVGVYFSCWAIGYVTGYQIRMIWDAWRAA